jgi:hypothetical protein
VAKIKPSCVPIGSGSLIRVLGPLGDGGGQPIDLALAAGIIGPVAEQLFAQAGASGGEVISGEIQQGGGVIGPFLEHGMQATALVQPSLRKRTSRLRGWR